jgi:SOS response associated peptidase (SRAP)
VSWKLSCTVLRGGTTSNGGSLLDEKTAAGKQPYALALADRGIMALAGLWENWRLPAGEWVRSFAIVTTSPNAAAASPSCAPSS